MIAQMPDNVWRWGDTEPNPQIKNGPRDERGPGLGSLMMRELDWRPRTAGKPLELMEAQSKELRLLGPFRAG